MQKDDFATKMKKKLTIFIIFDAEFFLRGCVGCRTSPERLCSVGSTLGYKYLFKVGIDTVFRSFIGRRGVNHNHANSLFKVIHELLLGFVNCVNYLFSRVHRGSCVWFT